MTDNRLVADPDFSVSFSLPSQLKAAWNRYHATLKKLEQAVESSAQYASSPRQRARAYHALFEVQAFVYNFAIAPRLEHPRIFHNTSWQTDIYSVGGNGPDFHYGTVFLDGQQSYRLTGHQRDSQMLLAQLNSALPGTPGARIVGNYDFADFDINPDGSFEMVLSAEKPQQGNWIELERNSGYQWLLFRPLVETWNAIPADLKIECISPVHAGYYDFEEFDEAAIVRRIDFATHYARYLVEEWVIGFWPKIGNIAKGQNIFTPIGSDTAGEVGSPTAEYVMATFEVGDDEALVLELKEEPAGVYWSFQLQDVWLRSLNFRTRQTTLNARQIDRDSDGVIRIVLSQKDPGVANWLDTLGYEKGLVTMRHYRAPKTVVPTVQRVNFSDLDKYLAAGARRLTLDERTAQLGERRAAYLRRHGE